MGCISIGSFAQRTYVNPVVDLTKSAADVTVFQSDNGEYYMFNTDPINSGKLLKSKNLTTWETTDISPISDEAKRYLKNLAEKTSNTKKHYPFNLWAPMVVKVGDKWNLYTSIENWGGIVVLQSDCPTGPYKFAGAPYTLVTPEDMGWPYDAIDPCVVQNGKNIYMFFGSAFGIYRTKLTKDGLHITQGNKFKHVAGPTSPTQKVDGKIHGGMEGVFVYKHNKWWYLFCSKRLDYSIYVGRSRKITGKFFDKEGRRMTDGYGTRMNYPIDGFKKPGHNGEIFTDKDNHYYIFYHATTSLDTNKYGKHGHRQPCLSEMLWDNEGFPYLKDYKTQKNGNLSPRL